MRLIISVLLINITALLIQPLQPAGPLADPVEQQIEDILASLNPTERVGQLMMVTFEGTYLDPETGIARLITEYNIGGVMIEADNDNINGQVNTPRLVQSLTTQLQMIAYAAAEDRATPRAFIPLFIATTHAGNGQPHTQIALGTTPLPSYMALGATWNSDFTRQVGEIAGSELSTMGINVLFGPALDVMQRPQTERALDLGVNTFGGEPYWVGEMGQAYITGIHEGSQGRIAVIAQHFPGLGLADTQPDMEIPVVPRSVEELRQFDLIPYYAVTGGTTSDLARADGLQCANIRYQGENIRSITRPVCIDDQAATQLLSLDYFNEWRTDGLMVSSSLGTRAIRRYYSTSPFPHRQVARELGESLRRILRLKLSLYANVLSLENVLTTPRDIDSVGSAIAQLYPIAQKSVTLIAPRRESLPPPPTRDENIIVFTDLRLTQQCSYCATYPLVSANALEAAIERMYGPYAGAQVRPEQVVSFSFAQLESYLRGNMDGLSSENSQFKTSQRIGEALREVDWIVFVMLDVSPTVTASSIVRDLLETDSTRVDRAKIVASALGAPIYLSSTEISKFTAFYGLYSLIPPYIDAAARALYQETGFEGALPISVPAIGYDVLERTAPDPAQTIRLEIESLSDQTNPATQTISDVLTLQTGDQLVLKTAPILDRNGHRVPDQTPVEFTLTFLTDNLQTRQYGATQDGIAQITFSPNRTGRVQITASSVDATRSSTFQIVVVDSNTSTSPGETPAGDETQTAATPLPTGSTSSDTSVPAALVPTGAAGNDSTGSGTSADTAAPASQPGSTTKRPVTMSDFVLSLFGLVLLSGMGFAAGLSTTMTVDGGVRVVLGSIVAGLTGYIYFGLDGPGVAELAAHINDLAPVLTTLGAGLIGLIYSWWTLRY